MRFYFTVSIRTLDKNNVSVVSCWIDRRTPVRVTATAWYCANQKTRASGVGAPFNEGEYEMRGFLGFIMLFIGAAGMDSTDGWFALSAAFLLLGALLLWVESRR